MRLRNKLLLIILGIFFNCSVLARINRIIETDNIKTILNFVSPNSLVVFDIDHTIFHSKTRFGSPQWIFGLIDKEMQKGKTKEQAFAVSYPKWLQAQQQADIELVDGDNLNLVLDHLRKNNILAIAFTARQPVAGEITIKQLALLKINFNNQKLSRFFYDNCKFSNTSKPDYTNGVLFAHDYNSKGKVFSDFIKQFNQDNKIQRIIFIDDTTKNVQSMATACQQLSYDFIGVRYSKDDKLKAAWDQEH